MPAEGSVPIDTIVPIVSDVTVIMMAVFMMTMLMAMTLMAMAVTGKCGRSNEQGEASVSEHLCRKRVVRFASALSPPCRHWSKSGSPVCAR